MLASRPTKTTGGASVNLCECCARGQLEMCSYFRENFLESGGAVRDCPEFEPEEAEGMDICQETAAGGTTL